MESGFFFQTEVECFEWWDGVVDCPLGVVFEVEVVFVPGDVCVGEDAVLVEVSCGEAEVYIVECIVVVVSPFVDQCCEGVEGGECCGGDFEDCFFLF